MITEIRRLEHAIQATEIPTHIARDCLGNRQRRIDTDLVQDDAENQLLKVSKDLVQLSRRLNFYDFYVLPHTNYLFRWNIGASVDIPS